jgi:hypothetical protein
MLICTVLICCSSGVPGPLLRTPPVLETATLLPPTILADSQLPFVCVVLTDQAVAAVME